MLKLSAPKQATWWIALGVGVLGILVRYRILPVAALMPYAFLLVTAALLLLLFACVARGL